MGAARLAGMLVTEAPVNPYLRDREMNSPSVGIWENDDGASAMGYGPGLRESAVVRHDPRCDRA